MDTYYERRLGCRCDCPDTMGRYAASPIVPFAPAYDETQRVALVIRDAEAGLRGLDPAEMDDSWIEALRIMMASLVDAFEDLDTSVQPTCVWCDEPFDRQRSTGKYCSDACRQRAYRGRGAEARATARRKRSAKERRRQPKEPNPSNSRY